MYRLVDLTRRTLEVGLLCGAVVACLLFCARATAAEEAGVLMAGAATSNITPPLGEMIVGNWEPVPAAQVHDELHARCLVLAEGPTKLVFVICDNVGIPREVFDEAKKQIAEKTGIERSHVLTASTHTHSATTARGPRRIAGAPPEELNPYQSFLVQRIVDGVRRALGNLEPAQIGWGKIDEPSEVFNRRWFVKDASLLTNPFGGIDRVRMNPPRGSAQLDRPAGPVDPEISFLSVQSTSGRPIALLGNYSLHYVGGVPNGEISADYFGYFGKLIEKKLNAQEQTPRFVGILSNGTSGDVNNIHFAAKTSPKYAAYEKMQEVANKVASRVAEAHEKIEFRTDVKLAAKETELELQVRQPTEEMRAYLAGVDERGEKAAGHRRERSYARRIASLEKSPKQVSVPLQTFQIGELGIAAVPFETFAETGLEIKDRSPFPDTFTIELAGGSFGYLPTPEQHRLGGYETWLGTNYVEKEATVKIVNSLMDMFEGFNNE
ncbi:Neutral/alkaline non-lysosomal ceramidase [Roseimaritima multifibrata]|uniref:Neutral/alkaline non-lysosomal ceramidase n=1 Tax=Roseimaritima multifibrata TaxID=1930274 RepID=A0A517MNY1_9BACT|nr:Neutral/alkaline non-lysosomal ceramidase [Roseimaritima multifibrata]